MGTTWKCIAAFREYWSGPLRLMLGGEMDGAMYIRIGRQKEKPGGSIYPYRACMIQSFFRYSELVVDERVDEDGYRYDQCPGGGYFLRRPADDHQGTEERKSPAYYR